MFSTGWAPQMGGWPTATASWIVGFGCFAVKMNGERNLKTPTFSQEYHPVAKPPWLMGSEPPIHGTLQLWVFREKKDRWHRPVINFDQWPGTTRQSLFELNFDTTLHTETDADDADWCFFCLPTTSGRSFVKYILFVESMPFLKIPRFLWVKPSSLPRPKKQMST